MRFHVFLPLLFAIFGRLMSLRTQALTLLILISSPIFCETYAAQPEQKAVSTTGAKSKFSAGVEAFQKKDYTAARLAFSDALHGNEDCLAVLNNLALTEVELGQFGLAIALWRKALALSPGYGPARAGISMVRKKLDHPEIPHEVEYWETYRNAILSTTSLTTLVIATSGCLLIGGWLLLSFFGLKRLSKIEEKPTPPYPYAGGLVGFFAIIFLVLLVSKIWDDMTTRATVLPKKIEARSAPDAAATSLFELYEGLEVVVDQSTSGWLQVTYPGGPTGWVPTSALYLNHSYAINGRNSP